MLTPSGRSTSAAASPSESLPLISPNDQDEPKAEGGQRIAFEPDTPIRPLRWVDRLAENPPTKRDSDPVVFLSGKKEWLRIGLVGRIIDWIGRDMWPTAEAALNPLCLKYGDEVLGF